MKKQLALCLALSAVLGVNARAADYTFHTGTAPDYYPATAYEDRYQEAYRCGGPNKIDYDIPEIRFGLSQEMLEHSLPGAYPVVMPSGGQSGGTAVPDSGTEPIRPPYRPAVTLNDLKQKDGSIGTVAIPRVGLSCRVFEGATTASMRRGAAHESSTSLYEGNVGLFGHNRGSYGHFYRLKDVRLGDTVIYRTLAGTKTYRVTFAGRIASTDFSRLNEMGDSRLTLITCVANQPALRLCVQAQEVR